MTKPPCLVAIVRHQYKCQGIFTLKFADQFFYLHLGTFIQSRGGLIHNQQFWTA